MRVKALLIDFDGVLVDSTRAYMKATNIAMKNFGHLRVLEKELREISLEIARRLDLGFSKVELLDGIFSVEPDIIDFLAVWLNIWNKACLWEVDPFSGVYEILEDLSRRFPLALVTLRHLKRSLIEDQLKRLNFNKFFKVIITALDVKKPKPEPDSFLEGAKQLEVEIGDCAIVGDSVIDIRAGKAAGAKTIAVLTGLFDENSLKKERPDIILRDLTEILSHLSVIKK
ncbi:MAG: HAD family hydrolase [Candidatus Hodarchaeales archaeon]|jgi:phosphoglycolate phosphatase